MDLSYGNSRATVNLNNQYRQVTSNYVGNDLKPGDIDGNCRVFPDTFNINEGNLTYQYKPKVIRSGYIVGQPIAFTQTPQLPKQYALFSPSNNNLQKPVFISKPNVVQAHPAPFNLSTSVYKSQQPNFVAESQNNTNSLSRNNRRIQVMSSPVFQDSFLTVKRKDYDLLKAENLQMNRVKAENLQLKRQNAWYIQQNKRINSNSKAANCDNVRVRQLEDQVSDLNSQILKMKTLSNSISPDTGHPLPSDQPKRTGQLSSQKAEQIQLIFSQYLHKYHQSILQQQRLLVDRFRLQCKNQQLQSKKYQMQESRRQQRESNRKHSLYQKNQCKLYDSTQDNFNVTLKSQFRQRHYRK